MGAPQKIYNKIQKYTIILYPSGRYVCLDIFYNRKVYKLSEVARRRKGGTIFFSEKWKAKWKKKGRSKNEAA